MAQDRMADRTSKHIHAQIYSNAKATSARKFLREFVKTAPYDIRSIQVDGGSEFMAEFETECKALDIPLIIYDPSPYPKSGTHFSGRWKIAALLKIVIAPNAMERDKVVYHP